MSNFQTDHDFGLYRPRAGEQIPVVLGTGSLVLNGTSHDRAHQTDNGAPLARDGDGEEDVSR